MPSEGTIYDEIGVPRVVNGVGTRTQVSGARLRDGVAGAMARAAESHVYIADLQAYASERIAEATGADAGLVTPGALAGLVVGTAACITGDDFEAMARPPDTKDIASNVVIPKAHRIKYDIGFRACGATLVDVGHVSHHPVNGGVDRVEPWQIASAIDEETAAVAYVQRPHNVLDLEAVVDIAHDHNVPVIVDAASEVPPQHNLKRFIDVGADLVAFSGGKGIGGPQPTGFLAGQSDLIRPAALLHIPDGYHEDLWRPPADLIDSEGLPHGIPANSIGRPLKIGPEEIIGLLTALEKFLEEDDKIVLQEWVNRSEHMTYELDRCPHLDVRMSEGQDKASGVPKVIGRVRDSAPISTLQLIKTLRHEDPRVWVGERYAHLEEFTVSPQQLTDDEAAYLVDRVLAQLD